MITNRKFLAVVGVAVCCITVIWFSTTTQGGSKTYELQPRISLPQYKTDTVRAIDAYERLMERYMNVTEKNSNRINLNLQEVIKRLDSIDDSLTELSMRIARIENTFGITEPKTPAKKKPRNKVSEDKALNDPFPIW